MVCKVGFTNWNAKIALLCASLVVTYYVKLFRTGTDRHNVILMFLLLLVAETKISTTHAIISLIDSIEKAVDNNRFVCQIFIDLKKHLIPYILLHKLSHYEIRDIANIWLSSYF